MPNFELPFPFGGLNDNNSQSKQPSGTSSDAVNVRGIDPITGRVRGAQRSGLLKYTLNTFEARVKRFEKVVYDNRQLNYSALSDPTLEWASELGDLGYTISSLVDQKENLYITTSTNKLLKYNKNGVLIYTLSPTIDVPNAALKGIAVDNEFGVYVCVGHKDARNLAAGPSEFGNVSLLNKCWIARYVEQASNGLPTLAWKTFPKCAIEKVIYKAGVLLALGNDPINFDGVIIQYGNLLGTGPNEGFRRLIAYPAVDLDVDATGALYWTAPPNAQRLDGNATAYPGFRKSVVDWTPDNLDTSVAGLWSWYSADSIVGYDDNEELLVWEDITGTGRDWIKFTGVQYNGTSYPEKLGPKYRSTAFGGKPALEFNGENALHSNAPLVYSNSAAAAAPIPNIVNKATTVFMVVKPTRFDVGMYIGAFVYANKEDGDWNGSNLNPSSPYFAYPVTSRQIGLGSGLTVYDTGSGIPNLQNASKGGNSALGSLIGTNEAGLQCDNDIFTGSGAFRTANSVGPVFNAANGSGYTPTVAGYGAGIYGNPKIKLTYTEQDAYIVTHTFANKFPSDASTVSSIYNEFVSLNVPDDGVNNFHCIRVNGRPQDRWFGRLPQVPLSKVNTTTYSTEPIRSFVHTLGHPWHAPINGPSGVQTWWLKAEPQFNELPNKFNAPAVMPYTGYIAEVVVVTHDTHAFLPRYPRSIGLACPTASVNLTRADNFQDWEARFGSGFSIAAPISQPLNDPAWTPPLITNDGDQRACRVTGNNLYVANVSNGSVVKTTRGYYPVSSIRSYQGNFYLALNDTTKEYENNDGNTSLELNPQDCLSQAVPHDPNTITECERIEGYLAWKYGIWHNLPGGNYAPPTLGYNATYDPGNYPHPFRSQPPAVNNQPEWQSKTTHPTGVAACLESISGPYRWAVNGATLQHAGGIGWSIRAGQEGKTYTYGPEQLDGQIGVTLESAAVVNGGSGYSVGEVLTILGGFQDEQAQCAVAQVGAGGAVLQVTTTVGNLKKGNYLTVPSNPVSVSSSFGSGCTLNCTWNYDDYQTWPASSVVARVLEYDSNAQQVDNVWFLQGTTALHDVCPEISVDSYGVVALPVAALPASANGWSLYATNSNSPVLLYEEATSDPVHATKFEVVSPEYRIGDLPTDDFPTIPITALDYPRAENIFVTSNALSTINQASRYLLVKATSDVTNPSPRAQALLAVSNGKIKKVDPAIGITEPIGLNTLPQPELDAGSSYIDTAILFGKVYFTDGVDYRVYDPKKDLVASWQAQDAGSLPNRCKLLANWRGRAVLARGADDPHNWHMSEQGAPNNWDNFPAVTTATQAISGNNARAGLCPDLINSLIPYNDDLLLFGCDSSLWMMRGDPMAGGVFDLVSDVTGVAFGRSWAKDPEGNLYFFGSRGGVYIMKPGSIPMSMTQATIERRLTEVDLGEFYVEMFWNTYDDGLHLFMLPFTDTATHTKHFFWERRTGAWFQDEFGPVGNTDKQPSAAIVIDGDAPSDRCLLLGSYDGSALKWDKASSSDDSQIINSHVLIGPIAPDDTEMESRITNLAAVLANQGAVNYRLYASQTPDLKGEPVASGTLVPGRNPIHLVRARGAYVWIEIGQANAVTRWALESLRMDAYPAGRKRNA